jgi:hypothetical protein
MDWRQLQSAGRVVSHTTSKSELDTSGVASRMEVDQLVAEATAFVEVVEAWIASNSPALARD